MEALRWVCLRCVCLIILFKMIRNQIHDSRKNFMP